MNKSSLFFFVNLFMFLMYFSYSAPTLFFPSLANLRNLQTILVGLFFSAYPLGSFPASILVGKLMRFYHKDRLLLFLIILLNISKIAIGCLWFIDNIVAFYILALFARFLNGVADGCMVPIVYSYVPELFPDNIMVKFGILEIWGSLGVIFGGPIMSFIYQELGYFEVFAIMAGVNLLFGSLIIVGALKSDHIQRLNQEEKESLPLMDAFFTNKAVLMNIFYMFAIFFPNFMILPGFELYIKTLSQNSYICSIIYSCIFTGMIFGVILISNFYKESYKNKILFISGLFLMVCLLFYGPDPIFGIEDRQTQLILIAVAFFISGVIMEMVFLIITKTLINDLLEVFPGDHNLCADFANGLYTACFSIDHMLAPVVGSVINIYIGYARTGALYCFVFFMGIFIFYWILKYSKNENYAKMKEEKKIELEAN